MKQAAATGALSMGGCNRHIEHSREELPHIRGQRQKPGGPHARRVVAKRNYPTSEVRGSGQECQAAMVQEWPRGATHVRGQGQRPRGATLRTRPGAVDERSYPVSEVSGGWEEMTRIRGRGWQGEATSHPRPEAAAGRSNPRSHGGGGAGGPRGAIPH